MKTILFSILILFSINGFAFNWKKVTDGNNGNSYYVDVDNIKKKNGLLYYSRLEDFLKPKNGNFSFIRKFEVDFVKKNEYG